MLNKRKYFQARYLDLGEEVKTGNCTYCGEHATQMDHVWPVSQMWVWPENHVSFVVESCQDCNLKLGAKCFVLMDDRQKEVRRLLEKENKKLLNMKWSEKELNELGPSMQTYVLQSLAAQQTLKRRLTWKLPLKGVSTVIALLNE